MSRICIATWLLVGIQMVHSVEEYFTGFDRRFPVFVWYNTHFSSVGQGVFFAFNVSIVVMMALLSLVAFSERLRGRFPFILAWIELINGVNHILFSVLSGGYYPGLVSGLFFIPVAIWLLAGREPSTV